MARCVRGQRVRFLNVVCIENSIRCAADEVEMDVEWRIIARAGGRSVCVCGGWWSDE